MDDFSLGEQQFLSLLSPTAEFQGEFDFDRIRELASRFRVTGLTRTALSQKLNLQGSEIDASFRLEGQLAAARMTGRWWTYEQVIRKFLSHQIRPILLKGGHLSQTVYPAAGLRQMRDLDVLVSAEEMTIATELLLELGFKKKGENNYHASFWSENPHTIIELHFDLQARASTFKADLAGALARAEPIKNGLGFRLSREDEFVYLLLHIVKHRYWGEILPFLDLAYFQGHFAEETDWERVVETIYSWELPKQSALALACFATLFPADERYPASLRERLPTAPRELVDYVAIRTLRPDDPKLKDRERLLRTLGTYPHHQRPRLAILAAESPRSLSWRHLETLPGKMRRLGLGLTSQVKADQRRLLKLEGQLGDWL